MSLKYDPDFFKAFEPLIPVISATPKAAVHDVEGRRKGLEAGLALLSQMMPYEAPDVEQTEHKFKSAAGVELSIYSFIKKGSSSSTPSSAVLHCHGGGMILGNVAQMSKSVAFRVQETGIPFFSVEYRLAPESSGTNLVEDCYAGLEWLHQNASKYHVDPARIGVTGESAGGGLAAGVALMARDKGLSPPLAKQILIYPMLDDRNLVPNPRMQPFVFWSYDDNITGWTALLGADKAGKPDADVSPYCAPARVKSLAGLPSAYIDVGTLDIFRDEDLEYARRLAAEDIDVEFHLYPGVPHAFELFAPKSGVTERAMANRLRALLSF
ncbi:arylesterase/monooxygenase [Cladophialophora carrionii]|uniref:Arylesterase/monooxygenase n=1 Tax=Cladophialophora carrionii TaxID=86049 RepID=A0A1C1C9B7_9EURO|nr:arylesterase/monooxygenase [Cladophialophora carrionii]